MRGKIFVQMVLAGLVVCGFIVVGAATSPIEGQTQLFITSPQTLGSGANADIELGDLDNDGDLDAFFIENTSSGNQIYINQGGSQGQQRGTFQPDSQNVGDFTQRDVALGDLDNDGDLDAFLLRGIRNDSQHIWLNQGGRQNGTPGQFVKTNHLINNPNAHAVALGDIDRDGDLDAYIARVFEPDQLFLNDGFGNFGDSGRVLEARDSHAAAMADFDNDGDLDVFVSTQTQNTLWINQGGIQNGTEGNFLDSGQTFSNISTLAVAAGDLDGDGDTDVVTGNTLGNRVYLNSGGLQGGTAGILTDTNQSLGFNSTFDIDLADVDGDGDLDAIASNAGPNRVWINQGGIQGGSGGVFVDFGQVIGEHFTEGGELGDVDGDGDPDYVTATSGQLNQNQLYLNQSSHGPVANWQHQTLAVRGRTGLNPDIALDQFGHPHISFYHTTAYGGELHYMWWDGVVWHSEVVDSSSNVGIYSAIAVDANNRPHISYHDITNRDAKYATKNNGQWVIELVENAGDTGRFPDIALTTNGQPRITFVNSANQLKYASKGLRGWTSQIAAAVPMMGPQSLALTRDNLPRISFYAGELRVASWNGAHWMIDTVDGQPGVGTNSALAIDSQDRLHVVYSDDVNNRLHYALKGGGIWTAGVITTGMDPDPDLDITIDGQSRPAIVFNQFSSNRDALLLARESAPGSWQINRVDDSGDFDAPAIDWSGLDKAHIAYTDGDHGDLIYAFDGPDWQLRPLLSGGIDQLPEIAVRDYEPRIALRSAVNSPPELFLFNWNRPDWSRHPITPTLQLDYRVALAYDEARQPHLAYYENRSIRYAKWQNGVWNEEVVYTLQPQQEMGKKIELVLTNRGVAVVYSFKHSTGASIEVATRSSGGVWSRSQLGIAGYTTPIDQFAADHMANGDIALAYFVPSGNNLQLARANGNSWTFTPIANNVTISAIDLKINRHYRSNGMSEPVAVAYADSGTGQIRYAYSTDHTYATYSNSLLDTLSSSPTELALTVVENVLNQPRVALIDATTNALRMYEPNFDHTGYTPSTVVAGGPHTRSGLSFAYGDREQLVFVENNAAFHAFRSKNYLVVPAEEPTTTVGVQNLYNADYCAFVLNPISFCRDNPGHPFCGSRRPTGEVYRSRPGDPPDRIAAAHSASFSGDLTILGDLTTLFNGTIAGTNFVDLYTTHESEMTAIMFADPVLLWDSYRTLQDFMPGLQALTEGRGAEVYLTQEMIDNAASVWTRIAAAASPELAGIINTELAKSNNLHDYVGRSYDYWARDIGLDPPSVQLFLPVTSK